MRIGNTNPSVARRGSLIPAPSQMHTPAAGGSVVTAGIDELRFEGSSERIIDRHGDINAGSRSELINRILELDKRAEAGEFRRFEVAGTVADPAQAASVRRERLYHAYNDPMGPRHKELGAQIAAEISTRINRMAFTRQMLVRADVPQGADARIRVPENNVEAVLVTGPTQVAIEIIRQKYMYLSEVYIVANPRIEKKDISRGTGDILEELFLDTQQAFLTAEDRLLLGMLYESANLYNGITYFSGQLTPTVIATQQEQLTTWGYNPGNLLLSMDLLKDITTGAAFQSWLEPVSKLEIIMTGRLGTVLGMDVRTDGLREKRLKVLGPGEVMVTAAPENLGAYMDRGPIEAEPRVNDKDFPGRGWYCVEEFGAAISNAKGVARAKRI